MKSKINLVTRSFLALTFLGVIIACSGKLNYQIKLDSNEKYYNYLQKDFNGYIDSTRSWLIKNRDLIGKDIEEEINMNMPFHVNENLETNKAILLVHGLNDSPFTFHDIANDLANKGFYVQVLLLPGHGSKPQDLFLPNFSDWEEIVYHYSSMLRENYESVWLGGFSTGANLVTSYTLEYGGIDGLLLFSPAFLSKATFFEYFSRYLPKNIDFREFTNQTNLVRYESAPFNGLKLYSESAINVRRLFSKSDITIPSVISISQHDSVINSKKIRDEYFKKFTHKDSRLIWFGDATTNFPKTYDLNMNLPEKHISSASHMSITFKADNFYYGKNGIKRICHNGLGDLAEEICNSTNQIWYGAWADDSNGMPHARLTWNPYYEFMMNIVFDIAED
jgi:alpha-beta hydrolase superfamily lysophospholipase